MHERRGQEQHGVDVYGRPGKGINVHSFDFKDHITIIPSTGFFELKKVGDRKQPYYITMKGNRLFAMAGLWDKWKRPD